MDLKLAEKIWSDSFFPGFPSRAFVSCVVKAFCRGGKKRLTFLPVHVQSTSRYPAQDSKKSLCDLSATFVTFAVKALDLPPERPQSN